MAKGNRGWNLRAGNVRHIIYDDRHPAWKGDAARPETKRARAQRLFGNRLCEKCGKPAEIHHKDKDTGNNSLENIMFLCRRHHMEEDGRMENMRHHERYTTPPKPCIICGKMSKPTWNGRCHACDMYLRKRGKERSEYLATLNGNGDTAPDRANA